MTIRVHRHPGLGGIVFIVVMLGISPLFAVRSTDPPENPPEAAPAAKTAHKTYFSWNPFDLIMSGRVSVGMEEIFRLGERYFGFSVQYTTPVNYVMTGLVTANYSSSQFADEIQFSQALEFYINYYAKGRTRTMRYYPRIGLSVLRNPGVHDRGGYLSIGPCARVAFGRNFHANLALTTLKFKLWGGRNYSFLMFPVFDFMVGIDF